MNDQQQTEKTDWTWKQGFGWVQRDLVAQRILEGSDDTVEMAA